MHGRQLGNRAEEEEEEEEADVPSAAVRRFPENKNLRAEYHRVVD